MLSINHRDCGNIPNDNLEKALVITTLTLILRLQYLQTLLINKVKLTHAHLLVSVS